MVEMMKWKDGNFHVGVEVRLAVGMENQIVDVGRSATLQRPKQGPKSGKKKRPPTTVSA